MQVLNINEIEEVSGGINGGMVLLGMAAGIVGAGLSVAGMGTPISFAGAALAVEGAVFVSLGLAAK